MMDQVELSELEGVRLLRTTISEDSRGCTSKIQLPFSRNEENDSLSLLFSKNTKKGTVRGFHFQQSPHGEEKLISCSRGSLFDVILDLRSSSRTIGNWSAIELREGDCLSLFLPSGIAHGYQTTQDNTLVRYMISGNYSPDHAVTISPLNSISKLIWPLPISEISISDEIAPSLNMDIHRYN